MVNRFIKVFARLKKESNTKKIWKYGILQGKNNNFEDLSIFGHSSGGYLSHNYNFRFCKVFDQNCEQSDIFDSVARPVINSVLEGFNGTIFAYGQTGSGKTYTITGSPKNYNDRGIIPRSIQYIFAHNEKVSNKPVLYISYMEIYNEIGYDLLGTKKKAAYCLEELPRVILLEDKKGECHIRNLRILPVSTEEEAMRLLFLGDTNRTIAETPMNEYSSRSHCIFTIYITYRNSSTDKVKFSKLHLVDLAGSERVHKTATTGLALSEAKHINLSLHFLQQVILALSEQKRRHIPYRNSMMTNILKDSLCGNCLTVMIGNLAINRKNIQETVSTCKFAQRVSLLKTEPIINEISDPLEEVVFLRNRVKELEEKLSHLNSLNDTKQLNELQMEDSNDVIKNYGKYGNNLPSKQNIARVLTCLKMLKEELESQKTLNEDQKLTCKRQQEEIDDLKIKIDDKQKEIDKLKYIIDNIPEKPLKANYLQKSETDHITVNETYLNRQYEHDLDEPQLQQQNKLFDIFLAQSGKREDLSYYKNNINKKIEIAKLLAETIEQCQMNITYIRRKLEVCQCQTEKFILIKELEEQQAIYRKALEDMKLIRDETTRLEFGLKQTEIRANQGFSIWLNDTSLHQSGVKELSKNHCCQNHNNISQFPQDCQHSCRNFHDTSYNKWSISRCKDCDYSSANCCSYNIPSCYNSACCKNLSLEETRYMSQNTCQNTLANCHTKNQNLCNRNTFKYINNLSNVTNISGCAGDSTSTFITCSKYDDQCNMMPEQEFVPDKSNRIIYNGGNNMNFECIDNNPNTTMSGLQTLEPSTDQNSDRFTNSHESNEVTCDNELSKNVSIRKDLAHTKKSKNRKVKLISQLDTISENDQSNPVLLTNSTLPLEKVSKVTEHMSYVNESTEKLFPAHQQSFNMDLPSDSTSENSITNIALEKHNLSNKVIIDDTNAYDDTLNGNHQKTFKNIFKEGDSESFKEFVSTLELTGDEEIDQEIINFYRMKFV